MPNVYTYFDAVNMARAIEGLGPIGAGTANGLGADFGTTVVGGTALCVGGPLVLKGAWKGTRGIFYDIPKFAIKNYGQYGQAFGELYSNYKKNTSARREANQKIYADAKKKLKEIRELIKNKKFKEAKTAFNELGKLVKQGDAKLAEGIKAGNITPKSGSRLAKIGSSLKKFTGIDALSKGINNTIAKGAVEGASKGAKIAAGGCKALKGFVKGGGALTALIEFGVDTYENWEIYKTGTTSEKLEQAGKSAAVAAGAGVGWWAGHAAGAALGGVASAAIAGSAIGSVVPGLGTVIGAVIGIGCGLIGSWLGSKAAKAAVGPSVIEKKKQKAAIEQAREAQSDETKMKELVEAYQMMIDGREEMLAEGIDEQVTCPQDNTYVAQPELDAQLAGLHIDTRF